MNISLLVAVTDNSVIGAAGKRGFYVHSDMRRFRLLSTNHAVIMGRGTFESINEKYRPLANRLNIVLSRNPKFAPAGVSVANSLDQALTIAKSYSPDEIFIIGGQSVFDESIDLANKIYLTRVHTKINGDRFFRPDLSAWRQVSLESHQPNDKDKFAYDFIVLHRR